MAYARLLLQDTLGAPMNDKELQLFLAKAAIIDKRNVDRATILHWAEVLGDITYLEANAALIHVRRTIDPKVYLVPSHITRKVYAWRDEYARSHPANPGTQGLVYVRELGQYMTTQDAGRALAERNGKPGEEITA